MYPYLLSQVLRGYWFLRPEDVIAGQAVVNQLLSGGYADEKYSHLLSESSPMPQVCAGMDTASYDKAPEGSTAVIALKGTLLKYGTWCSYGADEIAARIREATAHPNISSIVLSIDSGGGACDAVAPLVSAIADARAAGVPVVASCDLCASAAYWIASACDRIIADNDISSEFGSIGVMCSFADARPMYEQMGYKFHEIYADQSVNKNEAFTLALTGDYSLIKNEVLNPLAVKFQEVVKANRPALEPDVPGILSGKVFYAGDALQNGLIDRIGSLPEAVDIARKLSAEYTIHNYINS